MKGHWWQINRCRTVLLHLAVCTDGNLQTSATSLADEVSDWTYAGVAVFQSLVLQALLSTPLCVLSSARHVIPCSGCRSKKAHSVEGWQTVNEQNTLKEVLWRSPQDCESTDRASFQAWEWGVARRASLRRWCFSWQQKVSRD